MNLKLEPNFEEKNYVREKAQEAEGPGAGQAGARGPNQNSSERETREILKIIRSHLRRILPNSEDEFGK